MAFLMSRLPYMEGAIDLERAARATCMAPRSPLPSAFPPGNHLIDVWPRCQPPKLLFFCGGQRLAAGPTRPITVHLNPHHAKVWLPETSTGSFLPRVLEVGGGGQCEGGQ